ncbi:MAG: hypothetical protein HY722_00060 [Planctomycetes bacterium]|nr:hypothetical protein [Planctomycetota bacterium]
MSPVRLAGLALVVAWVPWWGAYAQASPFRDVAIADRRAEEEAIRASGRASLPEGTVVVAGLWFQGRMGPWARAAVKDGRFEVRVAPVRGRVVHGEYRLRIEARPEDQPPELARSLSGAAPLEESFPLGDPAERQAILEAVHRRLALARWALVEGHLVHRHQAAVALGYARAVLGGGRALAEETLAEREALRDAWEAYQDGFHEAVLDPAYDRYSVGAGEVFLSPLPEAEEEVENLFHALDLWEAAQRRDLHALLALPLSPFDPATGFVDDASARVRVEGLLAQLTSALETFREAEGLSDVAPEEVEGWPPAALHYRSPLPPFVLERPGPAWTYLYMPEWFPVVAALVPPGEKPESGVRVYLELVWLAAPFDEAGAEAWLAARVARDWKARAARVVESLRPTGGGEEPPTRYAATVEMGAPPETRRVREELLLCPCLREGVVLRREAPVARWTGSLGETLDSLGRHLSWGEGCPLGR